MEANVRLSAEEWKLVSDPAWILTKNSIIRKVVEMFGGLSGAWREMLVSERPGAGAGPGLHAAESERPHAAAGEWQPKISKGEQYKGLPWVMLDYPRIFGREDVLAIRTMFWWGHCFSVTLHLKGKYLRLYLPVIRRHQTELETAGFWPGSSDDEWEHEHRAGTYGSWDEPGGIGDGQSIGVAGDGQSVGGIGDGQSIGGTGDRPFVKLSAIVGLDKWDEAPSILTEKFAVLAGALNLTVRRGN